MPWTVSTRRLDSAKSTISAEINPVSRPAIPWTMRFTGSHRVIEVTGEEITAYPDAI
jgi:hypothetical protein